MVTLAALEAEMTVTRQIAVREKPSECLVGPEEFELRTSSVIAANPLDFLATASMHGGAGGRDLLSTTNPEALRVGGGGNAWRRAGGHHGKDCFV